MSSAVNGTQELWLIKSANRVMGPFKLNEVIAGLQLKHFTIMDEISPPFGRWILIRDELALQAAVKEIRSRPDSVENTATLTQTLSSSMSMSQSLQGNLDKSKLSPQEQIKLLASQRQKLKKSGFRRIILGFFIVLVAAAGAVYVLNKNKLKESGKDVLAQSLQLKSLGFYDRAFALLTRLKSSEKSTPQVDLELAIYQIVLQNQNVLGRKNIERLLNQVDSKESQASAYTALALSYYNEFDYKNAIENINKALSVDSGYLPAMINKAIINFSNGTPEVAEQSFEPVMNQTNNGVVVIGSTLASIEVNRKGLMPKRILPVLLQMLDEYLKNNYDLQQEAYILKAYINTTLGKKINKNEEVLNLLNSDLESGQGHRYDLLVDRSFLSWKNLLNYCQTVVESEADNLLYRSLLAYCYSKAGNDLEAKKVILEAEVEAPRNPHVAAIKAYVMRLLGQDAESQASLGVALSDRNILSAWLLKSKYCEKEKNDNCVQEALMQLMSVNSRSLPSYVGMAKLELRKGNKKAAQDWVSRGQALSTTFIPLWELKSSL